MMGLFLLGLTLISILCVDQLFQPNRLMVMGRSLGFLVSVLCWVCYIMPITGDDVRVIFMTTCVMGPVFIYVINYDKIRVTSFFVKGGFFMSLMVMMALLIANGGSILFFQRAFIGIDPLYGVSSMVFLIVAGIFFHDSHLVKLPRLGRIRSEILLIVNAYVGLNIAYFYSLDQLMILWTIIFYSGYLFIILPFLVLFTRRTLRFLIHSSLLYSVFLVGGFGCYAAINSAISQTLPVSLTILYICLLLVGLILLIKLYKWGIYAIDQRSFFSSIDQQSFDLCKFDLNGTVSYTEIQHILEAHSVFKQHDEQKFLGQLDRTCWYSLQVWVNKSGRLSPFFNTNHEIDPTIMPFMQFQQTVVEYEFDEYLAVHANTPLVISINTLRQFMNDQGLIELSLLQYMGEVVGAFGVHFKGPGRELMFPDREKLNEFFHILSGALFNAKSVSDLINHQEILEKTNMTISKFDLDDSVDNVVGLTRSTICQMIPEINYFMFLNDDRDSGFYKCLNPLNFLSNEGNFKLHVDDINVHLKQHMVCRFDQGDVNTPTELDNLMSKIRSPYSLVIRVNDSHVGSIIILLSNSPIDLMDYRILFCQMFLRQYDVFFDYQSNYHQIIQMNRFLEILLSQLPAGVMMVNNQLRVDFVNSKMVGHINKRIEDIVNKSIYSLSFQSSIIRAIEKASENRTDVHQKIVLNEQGKDVLFLLSCFVIFKGNQWFAIVVLTNIQQSKELIDQMNQTNRLVMMSKIANDVANELASPVDELISGVTKLSTQWQDESFQSYFKLSVIPQADRINLLCQSLLRLSRANLDSINAVFLPDLLTQALELISGDLQGYKQKFYIKMVDDKTVYIDSVMALQVLMNMMIFSLHFLSPPFSQLSITLNVKELQYLHINIMVQDFNELYVDNLSDFKNQFELSIVNQIVNNQNGVFNIYIEGVTLVLDILLPIERMKYNPMEEPMLGRL